MKELLLSTAKSIREDKKEFEKEEKKIAKEKIRRERERIEMMQAELYREAEDEIKESIKSFIDYLFKF
jgi:Na+/phosphate symporter